jgi:hypothetical protein
MMVVFRQSAPGPLVHSKTQSRRQFGARAAAKNAHPPQLRARIARLAPPLRTSLAPVSLPAENAQESAGDET